MEHMNPISRVDQFLKLEQYVQSKEPGASAGKIIILNNDTLELQDKNELSTFDKLLFILFGAGKASTSKITNKIKEVDVSELTTTEIDILKRIQGSLQKIPSKDNKFLNEIGGAVNLILSKTKTLTATLPENNEVIAGQVNRDFNNRGSYRFGQTQLKGTAVTPDACREQVNTLVRSTSDDYRRDFNQLCFDITKKLPSDDDLTNYILFLGSQDFGNAIFADLWSQGKQLGNYDNSVAFEVVEGKILIKLEGNGTLDGKAVKVTASLDTLPSKDAKAWDFAYTITS